MTLSDVIRRIEVEASKNPLVNTIVENDVWKLNGMPDTRYGVFAWTQGSHSAGADDDERRYNFNLFYVDRLTADKANQVEVQSAGVEMLDNLLRGLADEWGVEDWTITTFNQRFNDECAGAYVSVALSVPVNSLCAEDYGELLKGDFTFDYNQDFFVRKLINKSEI